MPVWPRRHRVRKLVEELKRLREFFGRFSHIANLVQSFGYFVGRILGFRAVQLLGQHRSLTSRQVTWPPRPEDFEGLSRAEQAESESVDGLVEVNLTRLYPT